MKRKRVYRHYKLWEDWKWGFWDAGKTMEEKLVNEAFGLLANPFALRQAMRAVIWMWPTSAEVNMTNPGLNKQAWLGQSACCLKVGAPEHLTKLAWHRLTEQQQTEANAMADQVAKEWEASYAENPARN